MFKKRILAVLLSMVMTATMLVALPTAAHAATGMATIDVSLLGATNQDNSGAVGTDSQWNYDASQQTLFLTTTGGNYTLTGTNPSLSVKALGITNVPSITLNNVSIGAPSGLQAITSQGGTIQVANANTITGELDLPGATITGDGSLTVTATGTYPLYLYSSGLSILGFISVTAIGTDRNAISYGATSILIGDSASLTMGNGGTVAETHTFTKGDATTTHVWKLTGDATLAPASGPLYGDTIIVTIPAGGTGTVERAIPVCEIVDGVSPGVNAPYTTLAAALAAVPTGGTSQTVIRLLTDITEPASTTISNKRITFDLNGKNLLFTGNLFVGNDSIVNYTGVGQFKVVFNWTSGGSFSGDDGLTVEDASTVVLTGVEIKDNGTGTNRFANAIYIRHGSTVTVNGDVKAESNGATDSTATGIFFGSDGGTVTVTGDIISSEYGVTDNYSTSTSPATVTVSGAIKADGDGVVAGYSANLTVNGDIFAGGEGVIATADVNVTINGDIEADWDGVFAEFGAKVTVTGNITAFGEDGVEAWDPGTEVTVTGSIEAPYGVFANNGAKVTITGDIVAELVGVLVQEDGDDVEVSVSGSITAGYVGVVAWDRSVVYVGGNIVVSGPDNPAFPVCGVFVADGAKVTVDGTITAPHYVGFLIPFGGEFDPWFYYVEIDGNKPSSVANYFEYNDEGSGYDILDSYVWVKDPRTLTPGTGDSSALWLLFGALLVAALGTGCVLAYRRREQEV